MLDRELAGIHRMREWLHDRGFWHVVVSNYHLATDVGSDDWERITGGNGNRADGLDILLRGLRRKRLPEEQAKPVTWRSLHPG